MKTLILAFLAPPGFVLVALGLALYWLRTQQLKRVTWALVAALVLAWPFTTTAIGRLLSVALMSQVEGRTIENPQEADMIITLTGGMDYAGNIGWLPKQESYRRMAVAQELQSLVGSRVPILLSGGRTEGVQYPSEAQVTARFFDRKQAQYTPILLEESSTNTYENALQVAAIIQKRQAHDVFLVTSEVHMLRALATFRARGVDPVPFPAIMLPRGRLELKDYLPSPRGVKLNAHAFYEIYGILSYLASGKIKLTDLFYKQQR